MDFIYQEAKEKAEEIDAKVTFAIHLCIFWLMFIKSQTNFEKEYIYL